MKMTMKMMMKMTMMMMGGVLLPSLVSADQREVVVQPEKDVTLQCRAPRGETITLLEWSRPDHKAEGFVFFYRNERSYENYQHPSYRGRVELRDPEMKDGDVSVVLKNVSLDDTGTYECRIIITNNTKHSEIKKSINVTVTDSAGNILAGGNMNVYLGVVVGLTVVGLLLVFVVIVIMMVRKCSAKEVDKGRRGPVLNKNTTELDPASEAPFIPQEAAQ